MEIEIKVKGLSEYDQNYPNDCRDFSKYHLMLIGSVMLMSLGLFTFVLIINNVEGVEA